MLSHLILYIFTTSEGTSQRRHHNYGVFIYQVLPYANACMDYRDCVGPSKTPIAKLRNQFYSGDILRKTFRKLDRKYQVKFEKFDISTASDHVIVCGAWTKCL